MSRPRNKIRREKVLYAAATEGEQREVHAAAGLQGLPIGEFVRMAALDAARKALNKALRTGRLPK